MIHTSLKCGRMQKVEFVLVVAFSATLIFAQSESRQNLNDCLNGLAACDVSQLTPADVRTVSTASRSRNRENCLNGLSSCDPTRLTLDEAKSVKLMYDRRNSKS